MSVRSSLLVAALVASTCLAACDSGQEPGDPALDAALEDALGREGFTGRAGERLEARLGRPVDAALAEVGRLLFFDAVTGLNDDNACGNCHAPTAGFGDTQSIAIGIESNGVVGPGRTGPRNQRRTPMAINAAFYPALMWNGRFNARSGDPFDNSGGFAFPAPKDDGRLSYLPHLLTAQAFIPPTERNEAAGFHFAGTNDDMRDEVARRVDAVPAYRRRFAGFFPTVGAGGPVTYEMFARAIAEFEFTLTFADAPVDRFARGDRGALTADEKRGALLFFGAAGCVRCHAVGGRANEMFSDFENHVAGVPQVVPATTNSVFDGPGADEDFGLEQVTGSAADRYRFRTSPLRNVGVQPTFFHNGAFTDLASALRYHLDAAGEAARFTTAGLAGDLAGPTGPLEPVLARLDPLLAPVRLTEAEFGQLLAFVRNGLTDPRARPERLRRLIPRTVPSGRPVSVFE
jgi:cytochrome c peroxidase